MHIMHGATSIVGVPTYATVGDMLTTSVTLSAREEPSSPLVHASANAASPRECRASTRIRSRSPLYDAAKGVPEKLVCIRRGCYPHREREIADACMRFQRGLPSSQ